jgi:NitT/TauT family transport system substrate-binding protein
VADPFNALAEVKEAGKILRFTGDVWRDHACCVTVVSENFLASGAEKGQGSSDPLRRGIPASAIGSHRTSSDALCNRGVLRIGGNRQS